MTCGPATLLFLLAAAAPTVGSNSLSPATAAAASSRLLLPARSRQPQPGRRVNWWFNALNRSFGAHEAAVAAKHRQAITGVYQWIQPRGFWVLPNGSVAFPPDENILAATTPLLAMELESGVCFSLHPGSLEGGGALEAIPALVSTAVKFNLSSYIVDLEYPGPTPIPPPPAPGGNGTTTWHKANGTGQTGTGWDNVYCSEAEAHLYAGFLRPLAAAMHAHGKRVGLCIEMGCIIGPEYYWKLYADTGVDFLHSMGSTYTGTNVTLNEQWLHREAAAVGPDLVQRLAVGIGSTSPTDPTIAGCEPPNVVAPWPTRYNWTESKLQKFVTFVSAMGVGEIALYRHDMGQMAVDCVAPWYYLALQRFLSGSST